MNDPGFSQPFTVVVGIDFKEGSGYALDQAATIAERIPGSQLHVVHVIDQGDDPLMDRTVEQLRTYLLGKLTQQRGSVDGHTLGVHVRVGKPAREIVQFAVDVSADLVLLGTHKGPHLKSLFVGSVAAQLVRAAPCPVLVAGPKPAELSDHVPPIEPPCPDCVAIRFDTRGKDWWCGRHATRHPHAHTYSYQEQLSFAMHDAEVIPTGAPLRH